ncbi:MMPL family transporter [Maridesulfovibrio sp.]|uniref:MMPL family transporter n=1 Tax=Maridesulfovibrio sp. TaxID=2795000 RepID=UPI002A18BB24|nr:MMPL family transporter [Maridesulfovibrio sp.]
MSAPGRFTPHVSRTAAIFILILCLLICALPLLRASFSEDISAMIPQGEDGHIAEDFRLLQKAPLADSVLISISSPKAEPGRLVTVADTLTGMMDKNRLELQNYGDSSAPGIIDFLLRNAPLLTTRQDVEKLEELTSEKAIPETSSRAKRLLLSPAGFGMKKIIAEDPLDLRSIYLQKLAPLKNLPKLNPADKYFLSKDRKSLLLIARSHVPMSDSEKAAALVSHMKDIREKVLEKFGPKNPGQEIPGLEISVLSGHVYSAANAAIIKNDILTVSIIALCALVLLFAAAFRKTEALTVFAAPGIAVLAGLGGAAFFYPHLSAIVIGFGAVLMGISIDFAVHTWFSLSEHPGDKAAAMHAVTRPILYGAATSCASFAALFISGIPGIRQLAAFSVCGIIAACAYALLFIPAVCNTFTNLPAKNRTSASSKKHGRAAAVISIIFLAAGIMAAMSNSFDTELKHIGYVSAGIKKTEKAFHEKWGDMRGQSMIFAKGEDIREALANNEKVWRDIKTNLPETKAVSIAPVLPSPETGSENSRRWASFWSENKIHETAVLLNRAATANGFAPHVFDRAVLETADRKPNLSPATLKKSPLSFLADLFIPETTDGTGLVLTMLPDNDSISAHYTRQKEQELGARLVSQSRFKASLEQEMKSDVIRFICLSGLLVPGLIAFMFRDARRAILATFPALFGVAATFGVLGMLSIPLNIFHIVALPLVIGLGADYGIFMVFQEMERPSPATIRAVTISGLTTLAGFGVLVFARHPSLHALGGTVAAGISAALVCAVFILPHFLRIK